MAGRVEEWERGGGITALMGPSGAGKTTLLNVLARRSTSHSRMEGDVRVNGHVLTDNEMKSISGYVTQHDGEHLRGAESATATYSTRLNTTTVDWNSHPLPDTRSTFFNTHHLPLLQPTHLKCCLGR